MQQLDLQALCDWLDQEGVTACAVSEHKRRACADLQNNKYELMWNECESGPNGGPAGGVGWIIRKSDRHLFMRTPAKDAPMEGPAVAWLRMGIKGGGHVDMASVYLNGPEKQGRRDTLLGVLKGHTGL